MDRHLNNAEAPPQPRYRGLTLPKLRLGRVKLVVFSEKYQNPSLVVPATRSRRTMLLLNGPLVV